MTIQQGLQKAGALITSAAAAELKEQGHFLTGSLERSIKAATTKINGGWQLQVTSSDYQKYLHWGVMPEKASMRQYPFVVDYFKKRGLEEKDAKRAAAATIKTWIKEGMPTKNSFTFAANGKRLKFLDDTDQASWKAVDAAVQKGLDDEINTTFHKTKSETI